MIALGDPLGTGLVESIVRPGGNVTGMSQMVPELGVKRLELLKEAVPKVSRVLVLSYLADPIAPLQVAALDRVAPSAWNDIVCPGYPFRGRSCGKTNVRFVPMADIWAARIRGLTGIKRLHAQFGLSEAAPKLIFGRQHVRSGGACTDIFSFQQMGLNWLSMQ